MPNLKRDDEPGEEEFWLEQNMSKLKISKWGLSKGQACLPATLPICPSAHHDLQQCNCECHRQSFCQVFTFSLSSVYSHKSTRTKNCCSLHTKLEDCIKCATIILSYPQNYLFFRKRGLIYHAKMLQ